MNAELTIADLVALASVGEQIHNEAAAAIAAIQGPGGSVDVSTTLVAIECAGKAGLAAAIAADLIGQSRHEIGESPA